MIKLIFKVLIFFSAILLGSYYFVDVSFIKAIQMSVIITIFFIVFLLIDKRKKVQ